MVFLQTNRHGNVEDGIVHVQGVLLTILSINRVFRALSFTSLVPPSPLLIPGRGCADIFIPCSLPSPNPPFPDAVNGVLG